MPVFDTTKLPVNRNITAPDGSEVRFLAGTQRSGMNHFRLAAGLISRPISHKTVDETWYVTEGAGELWRKKDGREEIVALEPGVCVTLPQGTHFQFRASSKEAVAFVGATTPPWPGDDEAFFVEGKWAARL